MARHELNGEQRFRPPEEVRENEETARRLKRIQFFAMLGSIIGCILLAGIYNLCFGASISYRGHRGWTGDAHDLMLGFALITGPCLGEAICWMIRRKYLRKR